LPSFPTPHGRQLAQPENDLRCLVAATPTKAAELEIEAPEIDLGGLIR